MTQTRPPIMYLADSPGLDFLNSWARPAGQDVEWLVDGEDLIAWLTESGFLDARTAAELHATSTAEELNNIAAQARDLREWFRNFVNRYRGAPLPIEAVQDLTALNTLLAQDNVYRPIDLVPAIQSHNNAEGGGAAIQRISKRRWRSAAALLLPIADALANVVCDADFTYVKQCEGQGCTVMFLDKTKGHARRWCSMAVCGNRAKQAAHREKMKHREG